MASLHENIHRRIRRGFREHYRVGVGIRVAPKRYAQGDDTLIAMAKVAPQGQPFIYPWHVARWKRQGRRWVLHTCDVFTIREACEARHEALVNDQFVKRLPDAHERS